MLIINKERGEWKTTKLIEYAADTWASILVHSIDAKNIILWYLENMDVEKVKVLTPSQFKTISHVEPIVIDNAEIVIPMIGTGSYNILAMTTTTL